MAKVLKRLRNFKIHFRIESDQSESDENAVLFGAFFDNFHQLLRLFSEKRFLEEAELYFLLKLVHDALSVDKKVLGFFAIRSRSMVDTIFDGLD